MFHFFFLSFCFGVDNVELSARSNPNLLINGGFDFWQRGESFNFGYHYTADRWISHFAKVTKVSNGIRAESNLTAPTDLGLKHIVPDAHNLAGKILTFSLCLADNPSGTLVDIVLNGAPINSKSKKLEGNGIFNETFETSIDLTDMYILIRLPLDTPSTYFILKYVKLELGSIATPFIPRPYGEELALCQRYYEKGFALFIYPIGVNVGGTIFTPKTQYITQKRIRPSIMFNSNGIGAPQNAFYANGRGTNIIGTPVFVYNSLDGFNISLGNIQLPLIGVESVSFMWEADAEIY